MICKALGYILYILLFGQSCELLTGKPAETWRTAFFKVLPILHLVFIAMSTTVKTKGHETYKRTIVVGLCFSMLSDMAFVWQDKHLSVGWLCFAITQLFYIRALGFKPRGVPAIMVSCLILAGLSFLYVESGIQGGILKILILAHSILIFTTFWRSWITMQVNPSIGALCALVGSVAFLVTDLLIAQDKFVAKIPDGHLYILGAYYTAQLFVTASVAYYKPHPYRKADETLYTYKERLN